MNQFLIIFGNRKRQRLLLVAVVFSIAVPLLIFKSNGTNIEFLSIKDDGERTDTVISDSKNNLSEEAKSLLETFNDTRTSEGRSESVPFIWCPQHQSVNPKMNLSMVDIDCDKLFSGDKTALKTYKSWKPPCSYSDNVVEKIACDCDRLRNLFYFETDPLSEEELNFPLAFIMVVEKHAQQVIRLLASLYQPQNIFCITYDEHSNDDFKRSMRCLAKCFKNVIVPEKHFEIYWGDISILDATMNCMRSLVDSENYWKYVQIISWNDLALKTNLEMVKIFKTFDGASDSELTDGQPERFRKYHAFGGLDRSKLKLVRSIPPHGVTVYKGSYAVSLPRELGNYLIYDPAAKKFLNWSRPMWCPEEQFFSSIIHNVHLNHSSSFPGTCLHYYNLEKKDKAWISRYQVWHTYCGGKFVSGSCVFGVNDIASLKTKPQLVAHKFYADFEPAAWYCVLKWRHEKTYSSAATTEAPLDLSLYENLPAVRYQKMVDKSEFAC